MNRDEITPRNALKNLDEAAAEFRGNRQQHQYLVACVNRLKKFISEQEDSDAEE